MSSYTNWVHTHNPFKSATTNSFQKLYVLVTDHEAKLSMSAHPSVVGLHQSFVPVMTRFTTAYRTWKNTIAFGKTATLEIDNLLEEVIQSRIEKWEAMIRVEIPSNNALYQSLFPEGRKSFNRGKKDIRISSIIGLAKRLESFPQLSTLQTEVETLADQLREKRADQQKNESSRRESLRLLHELREETCDALFSNLGYLIGLFPANPRTVMNFFQMELVRNPRTANTQFIDEEEDLPPPILEEERNDESVMRETQETIVPEECLD